jgi:hypothetical protein
MTKPAIIEALEEVTMGERFLSEIAARRVKSPVSAIARRTFLSLERSRRVREGDSNWNGGDSNRKHARAEGAGVGRASLPDIPIAFFLPQSTQRPRRQENSLRRDAETLEDPPSGPLAKHLHSDIFQFSLDTLAIARHPKIRGSWDVLALRSIAGQRMSSRLVVERQVMFVNA